MSTTCTSASVPYCIQDYRMYVARSCIGDSYCTLATHRALNECRRYALPRLCHTAYRTTECMLLGVASETRTAL
ncbi:hypothetical protein NDU88_007083 [Pleurodeles waltl]|uniref:Uncharacterized protein n=1 Tax=Pleurodeles waltl TaxID=8319 RepID=A0AAV7MFU5_PLEWA|nr:hypothetical protein NDU88_007083 [Pleurodeles waltl]